MKDKLFVYTYKSVEWENIVNKILKSRCSSCFQFLNLSIKTIQQLQQFSRTQFTLHFIVKPTALAK